MIVDRYSRGIDVGELNSGKCCVEKLGYVSPQRQIEALMYAGGRLMKPDVKEFDFQNDEDCKKDFGRVPVRDADLIDIGRMSDSLGERIESRRDDSVQRLNEKLDKCEVKTQPPETTVSEG